MRTHLDIFAPPVNETSTVVFAPYGYSGNAYNTGARLQHLAEQTGAVVIAAHAPGTGKVHVTSAERRSLRPDAFAETAARFAEDRAVAGMLAHFTFRVGLGNSGRNILVARMQLDGNQPFTHVLLRDGVNLLATGECPEPFWQGARRVLSQPQVGLEPVPEDMREYIKAFQARRKDKPGVLSRLLRGPAEMVAWRRVMCSVASREAVLSLASTSDVPFRYVDFSEGLTGAGSEQRSRNFIAELEAARQSVVDNASDGSVAAGHKFDVMPGNHADLLHPRLLVEHVRETLALTSAVPRP